MTTITVRNVSPELRDALKAKARRSGRSLQQLALEALTEKARRMDPEEWLAAVEANVSEYGIEVDRDDILRHLREMRGDPDA